MEKVCKICTNHFTSRKPLARTCSVVCRNTDTARRTAVKRGDLLRGSGAGKTYRKRNGRHEHRVIAEEILGRPLLPGEVVHHKDDNKRNNSKDNLEVLKSQAEHARLHATKNKQCSLLDCTGKHYAKGLCKKDYGKQYTRRK